MDVALVIEKAIVVSTGVYKAYEYANKGYQVYLWAKWLVYGDPPKKKKKRGQPFVVVDKDESKEDLEEPTDLKE